MRFRSLRPSLPLVTWTRVALACTVFTAAHAGLARTWDFTSNVRAAAGHKSNVLLSAVQPQESAFGLIEGEVFWTQIPSDRFELLAFANATSTHFVDSDENPHELQAFAHGEARWLPNAFLHTTATLEGYHLKQVFDLSVNNVDRDTALLAVSGGLASLAVRWNLPAHTWLELKPAVQRERFRDHSDDNRQHVARITLGRTFLGDRLEFSVAGQALRRHYDTRPQYTVAGRRMTGTELFFDQREGEARVKFSWGADRKWSTTTAALASTNRDNGSGFFNYHHRALRQELTWQTTAWKIRLTGRAGRYDYDVQTQGIGINPPFRLKEELTAQARLEHQWSKHLTLFTHVIWERSRSNDPLASYRVTTAMAGLDYAL